MGLGMTIVNQEITEAYDLVESILNRISVERHAALHAQLSSAKNHLFAARTLSDGSEQ